MVLQDLYHIRAWAPGSCRHCATLCQCGTNCATTRSQVSARMAGERPRVPQAISKLVSLSLFRLSPSPSPPLSFSLPSFLFPSFGTAHTNHPVHRRPLEGWRERKKKRNSFIPAAHCSSNFEKRDGRVDASATAPAGRGTQRRTWKTRFFTLQCNLPFAYFGNSSFQAGTPDATGGYLTSVVVSSRRRETVVLGCL